MGNHRATRPNGDLTFCAFNSARTEIFRRMKSGGKHFWLAQLQMVICGVQLAKTSILTK